MDNRAIMLHRVFTFPIAPKHIPQIQLGFNLRRQFGVTGIVECIIRGFPLAGDLCMMSCLLTVTGVLRCAFSFVAVVGFALSFVFGSGDFLFCGVYKGFKAGKHGLDFCDGF